MKVDKYNRPHERIRSRKSGKGVSVKHSPFLEILEQEKVIQTIDLDKALELIDEIGRELRQRPSYRELRAYKDAIRSFLSLAIEKMYRVETKRFVDLSGRRRVYFLVDCVDEKLEELTQLILESQVPTIELTRRLDEIRGLLLDINT